MCAGIAVNWREFTEEFIARHNLQSRVVSRNGDGQEVRFLYRDPMAQLPVWVGKELTIAAWGNRDNNASRLPRTGWCRQESLESGEWRHHHPEEVTIPACLGLEKGVWFQIKEGIRGILVKDEQSRPRVYMLTEPSSHYYEVMTRHDRMPVLIGERI